MPKTDAEIIIEKDSEIVLINKEKEALKAEKDTIQAAHDAVLSEKISLQVDKEALQKEITDKQAAHDAEKEALNAQISEKDSELGTLRAEKKWRDDQKVVALSKAKEKVVCGKLQRARFRPDDTVEVANG